MSESLRGDLARRVQQSSESSRLRGTLLRPSSESVISDPLAVGIILVNRDGLGDFTIERINERKGKQPLFILRGPKGETVSKTRQSLEENLAEEGGAWSYKNEPPSPKP